MDLRQYCNNFPNQLCVYDTTAKSRQENVSECHKPPNSYLHTCQYGDIPWRNKIQTLHESSSLTRASKSTFAQFPSDTSSKKHSKYKAKAVSKITGFQGKLLRKKDTLESVWKQTVVMLNAPDNVRGYSIEDVCIEEQQITLVHLYNEQYVLCHCELNTFSWKQIR